MGLSFSDLNTVFVRACAISFLLANSAMYYHNAFPERRKEGERPLIDYGLHLACDSNID